jgi:hypothetical protein
MITKTTETVYYAPTKGRRYFSRAAAIRAEARAIIEKHVPSEPPCRCTPDRCGMCGDRGWRLEDDQPERHTRYMRMITKALKATMQ